MSFRKCLTVLAAVLWPAIASAQITPTYTFTSGTTISSSQVNANFALLQNALNRTGGAITGNITATAGVTIDGVDLSAWLDQSVKVAATPSFAGLTITGSGAAALDVTGGINAGSGNVGIVDTTGKIPALSSTYLANLSGVNLTGIPILAGPNTFTGLNHFLTYSEATTTPSISGSALTINLALGTRFAVTANSNATITISNPVANGTGGSFLIEFLQDGTQRTFTWPASVRWAGGIAYSTTGTTGTNNKIDAVQCVYRDAGTSYLCTSILNF